LPADEQAAPDLPVSRYARWQHQFHLLRYPVALGFCVTIATFVFGACATLAFEKNVPGESWLQAWNRWDAAWFLELAQNGYPSTTGAHEHLIVLLPAYPAAIELAHFLIPDWHTAALLVSNVCFLGALACLFLLARLEGDTSVARRAVLFCAVFPTAFFLHAAYSESLFLLLTVAAFHFARRDEWAKSGVLGLLATATRLPGAAIFPALVLEYAHQRNFRLRSVRWNAAFLALIPLGTAAFLWINYHYFGDPLHFLAAQKQVWGAYLRSPFPAVRDNWYGIHHAPADERLLQYGGPLVAFLVLTIATVAAPFSLRPCYAIYLVASWVMIFCNSFPISSPRYLAVVFPLFLLLARATRRPWLRDGVAFISALFYAVCTMHFVRGWWAF